MSYLQDLTGNVYGNLKVIKYYDTKNTGARWYVLCCLCDTTSIVTASNLKSGNTTKCHKCAIDLLAMNNKTHGLSGSPLYKRWGSLKYTDSLCDEWKDFKNFHHDVASSFKKGYSLRRYDNSKKHSKDNSYWVSKAKKSRIEI